VEAVTVGKARVGAGDESDTGVISGGDGVINGDDLGVSWPSVCVARVEGPAQAMANQITRQNIKLSRNCRLCLIVFILCPLGKTALGNMEWNSLCNMVSLQAIAGCAAPTMFYFLGTEKNIVKVWKPH
jgi:hypothetical protein